MRQQRGSDLLHPELGESNYSGEGGLISTRVIK
jgi:hypothetical protein